MVKVITGTVSHLNIVAAGLYIEGFIDLHIMMGIQGVHKYFFPNCRYMDYRLQ